ncbi:hypothetical protein FDP41_013166 [Naegleria fowleri]|uniref:Uncharacterized protein n=1 Tax=Naegleria fowleri TaxID=5763 RepID=A0A6A5BRK2_NAEFO|nr:uncharacterized protein FDP41_013166 [Naegleria fowleri]KAF0980683.1 hypothetical protein FDP41_013166 [Naegleria fowleri]CAG4715458.1 unnamed protein product [Naegleria fowleri]
MSSYQAEAYHDIHTQPPQSSHYPIIQQPPQPSANNYPHSTSYFAHDQYSYIPSQPALKSSLKDLVMPFKLQRFIGGSLSSLVLILSYVLMAIFLIYWVVSLNVFYYSSFSPVYATFILLISLVVSGLSFLFGVTFMRMLVELFLSVYEMREKQLNSSSHQV